MNLVFVVHGVGPPREGIAATDPATRTLAGSFALRSRTSLEERRHVISPAIGPSTEYATFTLKAPHDLTVVELQWSDLHRTRPGRLGLILSFFQVLFGLRYIALAASGVQRIYSNVNKSADNWRASTFILNMLEGPILALNCVMFAGLAFSHIEWRSVMPWNGVVAMGAAGLALGLLRIDHLARLREWGPLAGVATLCLLLFQLFPNNVITQLAQGSGQFLGYARAVGFLLGILWGIVAVTAIWMIAKWSIQKTRGKTTSAYDAEVSAVTTGLRLWSLGIPLLWSYILVIPLSKNSPLLSNADLDSMTAVQLPVAGLNWTWFLVLALAAGLSWWRFKPRRNRQARRLILGDTLQWALALTSLLASLAMLVFLLDGGYPSLKLVPHDLLLLCQMYKVGLGASAALAALLATRNNSLRLALEISLDIVSHLRRIVEGAPDFVGSRFDAIVDDCITAFSPSSVVFVAHSQGTVLAADFLRRRLQASWHFVSMGSPLTHLYEHYFRSVVWNGPALEVGTHIASWVNLYRSADYVGREVVGAENEMIGPGGHTGYFGEPRLLEIIDQLMHKQIRQEYACEVANEC